MKRLHYMILPALAVVAGDLALKHATVGQNRNLIPGILSLDYTLNTGFAFSLFPQAGLASVMIPALILAVELYFIFRGRWKRGLMIGFGLVLGGAVGNLLDRIRFAAVRDMLSMDFFPLFIFNLADVGVVVGAALIFLFTFVWNGED